MSTGSASKDSQKREFGSVLQRMEGLTVALATPLGPKDELDIDGLERLTERVIGGGAACLFPLGWNGEQPLLLQPVRDMVMRETCRIAAGRIPVMVGVSEQSVSRTLEQAAMARDAGAGLILATPPYSYHIPQELIYEYFVTLASKTELPLVVYLNDEVGVEIELDTLLRLRDQPRIVGVKVFLPFIKLQRYYHRLHEDERFVVMNGDEYLHGAAMLLGMRYFIMGGPGCICPSWCTSIYRSAVAADWDKVRERQRRLTDFCDAVYLISETPYASCKYILERLGVCSGRISSPHRPPPAAIRKQLDKVIADYPELVAG